MTDRAEQRIVQDSNENESNRDKFLRAAGVVLSGTFNGVGKSLEDAVNNPLPVLGEVGVAGVAGFALARLEGSTGMLGLGLQLAGGAMGVSFAKDIFGRAGQVKDACLDAYNNGKNLDANRQIISETVGPAVLDTALMFGSGYLGGKFGVSSNRLGALSAELKTTSQTSVFRVLHNQEASGTSFVLDRAGTFGTAFHVADIAPEVKLFSVEGRRLTAKPIAALPKADVALLQAEGQVADLQPVRLANTALNLKKGELQPGAAIGIPGLERPELTIETGYFGRSKGSTEGRPFQYTSVHGEQFAHIDGEILSGLGPKPGMSGGPLFNEKKEVVGVVTANTSEFLGSLFKENGIHAPVDDLRTLMERVNRARRPGAALEVDEAARRLRMTPGRLIDKLNSGELDGFLVPAEGRETFASRLRGDTAISSGSVQWEWRVLVDKMPWLPVNPQPRFSLGRRGLEQPPAASS